MKADLPDDPPEEKFWIQGLTMLRGKEEGVPIDKVVAMEDWIVTDAVEE